MAIQWPTGPTWGNSCLWVALVSFKSSLLSEKGDDIESQGSWQLRAQLRRELTLGGSTGWPGQGADGVWSRGPRLPTVEAPEPPQEVGT